MLQKPPKKSTVTRAIIGNAAGCVQLDRRERPHERPAQAQAFAYRLVEIFRRHIAFANETHCLGQERALQSIEDEAIELAAHDDGYLSDFGEHRERPLDRRRRGPWGTAR